VSAAIYRFVKKEKTVNTHDTKYCFSRLLETEKRVCFLLFNCSFPYIFGSLELNNKLLRVCLHREQKGIVERLTALWAFNEAAFGGILHGLHLPVTGLFIGGLSVIVISLIGYYSENSKAIVKSMLIVASIKFVVAPYTPLNAYVALFIQGGVGFLLFGNRLSYKTAAFSLAFLTLLISSLQRIIVYTVVFGLTLWDSLNLFYDFILAQLNVDKTFLGNINFSWFLVLFYIFLHFIAGILIGLFSAKLPEKLENFRNNNLPKLQKLTLPEKESNKKKKRKSFLRKPSVQIILTVSLLLILLSYTVPGIGKNEAEKIGVMLIRFVAILIIWYLLVLPIVTKYLRRLLNKTKLQYGEEIETIILEFPEFKQLVFNSWELTEGKVSLLRIWDFIFYIFAYIIFFDESQK